MSAQPRVGQFGLRHVMLLVCGIAIGASLWPWWITHVEVHCVLAVWTICIGIQAYLSRQVAYSSVFPRRASESLIVVCAHIPSGIAAVIWFIFVFYICLPGHIARINADTADSLDLGLAVLAAVLAPLVVLLVAVGAWLLGVGLIACMYVAIPRVMWSYYFVVCVTLCLPFLASAVGVGFMPRSW